MNLKKIIIYEFEILFQILEEIKEKFNLDLISADNLSFDDKINKISAQY